MPKTKYQRTDSDLETNMPFDFKSYLPELIEHKESEHTLP